MAAASAAEKPASFTTFMGVRSPMGKGMSEPIMMRPAPTLSARKRRVAASCTMVS